MEQPNRLRDLISFYLEEGKNSLLDDHRNTIHNYWKSHTPLFSYLTTCMEKLKDEKASFPIRPLIVFTGMGSSYFCTYPAFFYLLKEGVPTTQLDAGNYGNFCLNYPANTPYPPLVIAISQSGESGEILELFERWKEKEKPLLIGITNSPSSTLAKYADIVFPLNAGEEKSVTSKTYTTSLLLTYLLARTIAHKPINKEERRTLLEIIEKIDNDLIKEKKIDHKAQEIYTFMGVPSFLEFLGQGPSLSTVFQSTLNYKEINKKYSEGQSITQFRHGSIEIITKEFSTIIFAGNKSAAYYCEKVVPLLIERCKAGKVAIITNEEDLKERILQNLSNSKQLEGRLLIIQNPIKDPYLSPLYEILIMQRYFCIAAEKEGLIPGQFYYSQKITQ